MSAAELQRWWAFYQVEPWGEVRGDLRMAILASALVNCWTGKGRKTTPADFLPDFYGPPATFTPKKRQSPQEMLAVLRRGTAAVGGRVVKKAG
jgi:hypothetical protein